MVPLRSTLLLISFLLFVSITIPLPQAANADAVSAITGGFLGGTILCTNASLPQVGTYNVIANAKVDVVCGDGSSSRVIKSVLTDLSGAYFFIFTVADTVLNDPGQCYLNVTIPPKSCIFNFPTGLLRYPIIALNVVDALVANLRVLVPEPCTYVVPA